MFRLDLGAFDLLLAASDFVGLDLVPDSAAVRAASLRYKGSSFRAVPFDAVLESFFGLAPAADEAPPVAFFGRRGRAFLSARPFAIETLPLGEFRLLPGGLRGSLSRHGLAALRFGPSSRVQFLVDPEAMIDDRLAEAS